MADQNDFEKLGEMLTNAGMLEHSPTKVAMLEQAVRFADSLDDVEASIEARLDLIDAATFSGAQEKTLVAFSWVLGEYDKNPDLFLNDFDILWRYKWVLDNCVKFPEISIEKILKLCDDFKTRVLASGFGLNSLYDSLTSTFAFVGHLEKAAENLKLWKETERDELSDCPACELHTMASVLLDLNRTEDALATMRPLLANEMTCSNKPQHTYAMALLPLYLKGRVTEADNYSEVGYEMTHGDHQYLDTNGDHLNYMILRGSLSKAIQNMERHLPMAIKSMIPWDRLIYFSACRSLLDELCKRDQEQAASLRVPHSIECVANDGTYDPNALRKWIDVEVSDLCSRFDRRNGNNSISNQITQTAEMVLNH